MLDLSSNLPEPASCVLQQYDRRAHPDALRQDLGRMGNPLVGDGRDNLIEAVHEKPLPMCGITAGQSELDLSSFNRQAYGGRFLLLDPRRDVVSSSLTSVTVGTVGPQQMRTRVTLSAKRRLNNGKAAVSDSIYS